MVYEGTGLTLVSTVMAIMELIDNCKRNEDVGQLMKHVTAAEDIVSYRYYHINRWAGSSGS